MRSMPQAPEPGRQCSETGEFNASDRALAMHGAPPGTPMSLEKALGTVHPEDRERTNEAAFHALRQRKTFQGRIPHAPSGRVYPVGRVVWRTAVRFRKTGRDRTASRHHGAEAGRDCVARKRGAPAICARSCERRNLGGGADTGELAASDRALVMHGFLREPPMTHEKALANVFPEDRPRVEEAFRRTHETGERFRVETRVALLGRLNPLDRMVWRAAICFWEAGDWRAGSRYHGSETS